MMIISTVWQAGHGDIVNSPLRSNTGVNIKPLFTVLTARTFSFGFYTEILLVSLNYLLSTRDFLFNGNCICQ